MIKKYKVDKLLWQYKEIREEKEIKKKEWVTDDTQEFRF
jgi:hypothetical protein